LLITASVPLCASLLQTKQHSELVLNVIAVQFRATRQQLCRSPSQQDLPGVTNFESVPKAIPPESRSLFLIQKDERRATEMLRLVPVQSLWKERA
jgi:hypothetical protein